MRTHELAVLTCTAAALMLVGACDRSVEWSAHMADGYAHYLDEEYDEAEEAFLGALEEAKTLEPGFPRWGVIAALDNLAKVYEAQGRYRDAERILRLVVDETKEQYGEDHEQVAFALSRLADVQEAMGDFSAAQATRSREIAVMRKVYSHPGPLAGALEKLARSYRASGDSAAARKPAREALDIRRRASGAHHPLVRRGERDVADIERDAGREAR